MSDQFLTGKLEQYAGWMRERKIPHASRVIPIGEAFLVGQWVLPTAQAVKIARNARSVALRDCVCRTHYQRCDGPLNTCLSLNDFADKWIAEGIARPVGPDEVLSALSLANQHGLVHLAVHEPGQGIWGLCSCCTCCCYQLQILRQFGRQDLVVRSEYVAVLDRELCSGCGLCIERCQFGARARCPGGEVAFMRDRCYGCGLCVTTCVRGAIRLELRP